MKHVILLIVLIMAGLACNQAILNNNTSLYGIEHSHEMLSEVITPLLDDPVAGYVVISKSALEYADIKTARGDQSGPKSIVAFDIERFDYHTPNSEGGDRYYHWGSPLICREVIADHGDVVEVWTLDPDEDPEKLGHGTLGADYIYKLKTFVRKIDLVPVLGSEYELQFEDQTRIKLEPGVAIGIPWGANNNNRAISVQHLHFEFPIPDSLLTLSYQPTIRNLSDLDGKRMLNESALLFLNDKPFCTVAEIRDDRLRTPVSYKKIGDYYLVELVENGIHMTLKTNLDLVQPYIPKIERPILTNKYENPPKWYYRISAGTPVYWEDGTLAGEVRQYFGHQSTIPPGDSFYCETMAELFDHMALCFKLSDIDVVENE